MQRQRWEEEGKTSWPLSPPLSSLLLILPIGWTQSESIWKEPGVIQDREQSWAEKGGEWIDHGAWRFHNESSGEASYFWKINKCTSHAKHLSLCIIYPQLYDREAIKTQPGHIPSKRTFSRILYSLGWKSVIPCLRSPQTGVMEQEQEIPFHRQIMCLSGELPTRSITPTSSSWFFLQGGSSSPFGRPSQTTLRSLFKTQFAEGVCTAWSTLWWYYLCFESPQPFYNANIPLLDSLGASNFNLLVSMSFHPQIKFSCSTFSLSFCSFLSPIIK